MLRNMKGTTGGGGGGTGGTVTVSSATSTSKGILRLTGALAGTADNPTLASNGVNSGTYSYIKDIQIGDDGRVYHVVLDTNMSTVVQQSHVHPNEQNLDKLGEDGNGNPTYNTNPIGTRVQNNGTTLSFQPNVNVKNGLSIINNSANSSSDISIENFESAAIDTVLVKGGAGAVFIQIKKNNSNTYTMVASKEYVDQSITGTMILQTNYNAATNTPDISSISVGQQSFAWIVSTAGTVTLGGSSVTLGLNDWIIKTPAGNYIKINNSTSSVAWGAISGNLTDQIDLKNMFATKLDKITFQNGGVAVPFEAKMNFKNGITATDDSSNGVTVVGLQGYEAAVAGTVPTKQSDGSILWKPAAVGSGSGTVSTILNPDYGVYTLSASQTANLANGNHIEFNTIKSGNMLSLTTGSGQVNGRLTLSSGKTYELMAGLYCSSSSSVSDFGYKFYDVTNNQALGTSGYTIPATSGNNNSGNCLAEAIVTPSTDIQIELRITENFNNTYNTIYADASFMAVKEIKSSYAVTNVTPDYGMFLLSANQTANIAVGNHVEFNTVSAGNLQISTGSGQTNGNITLKAGKIYELEAALYGQGSASNYAQYQFYDVTNSKYVGVIGCSVSASLSSNDSTNPIAKALISTAADTIVQLRLNAISNITTIVPTNSYVVVKEIQSAKSVSNGSVNPNTIINSDYGLFGLSTNQSSTVITNNHIEFDTVLGGNLSITTGSSQANGRVTLKAGRTYDLEAAVWVTYNAAGSNLVYQFYDVTNSKLLGVTAQPIAVSSGGNYGANVVAKASVTPATDIQVELRVTGISGTATLAAGYCYMQVYEIKGTYAITNVTPDYGQFGISSNQTTNLTANCHVEFNQVLAGNISLSSGSGQTNGRVTLKAGKTYELESTFTAGFTSSNSEVQIRFYDVTNSQWLGTTGDIMSVSYSTNGGMNPIAKAMVTTTTDIQVELRIVLVTGVISQINAGYGYMNVKEIQTAKALQVGPNVSSLSPDYAFLKLSADMSTNITVGNHIEFDTLSPGNLILSRGTGQANGRVTLKAGKTYNLEASLYSGFSGTNGYIDYRFYDVTNNAPLGVMGRSISVSYTVNGGGNTIAKATITTATDTQIELQIISAVNCSSVTNGYSYCTIGEIKSSYTPINLSMEYALFGLSANQSSNVAVGNHIEFNQTLSGNMTISTGAGQINGQVVLKAGKTYRLEGSAYISYTAANAYADLRFYDATNGQFLGVPAEMMSVSYNTYSGSNLVAKAMVTPTSDILVELRFSNITGGSISAIAGGYAFMEIVEISTSKQMDFQNIPLEYGQFGLSANQTSNLVVNNHIEFDTLLSGNINISKGAGQTNGRITLRANKTYELEAGIFAAYSATNGYIDYRFYDVTNSQFLGTTGENVSVNYNTNSGQQSISKALVTPLTDIQVELRITNFANLSNISTSYSFVVVKEIPSIKSLLSDQPIEYGLFYLSVAQTSNIANNNHAEFNASLAGNMAITTGTGQTNGRISLKAGKTYELEAALLSDGASNAGYLYYGFYDVTNGKWISTYGVDLVITYTGNSSQQAISKGIVTPSTDIVVELRFYSVSAVSTIRVEGGYMKVIEIKGTRQSLLPTDGKSTDKNTANQYQVKGFETALTNTYPFKDVDNSLKWVSMDKANAQPIDYGFFTMSGNMSSLSANSHVEYDTALAGNLTITTGTGQSKGIVTLKAGKTYKLKAAVNLSFSTNAGYLNMQFYNRTAGVFVGILGEPLSNLYGSPYSMPYEAVAVVTPVVDSQIELRMITGQNLGTITGQYSWMMIEELKNQVVQPYGTFESQVLFSGSANSVGSYNLADILDNWDYILVYVNTGATSVDGEFKTIRTADISYNKSGQFVHIFYNNGYIGFYFVDNTHMSINSKNNGTAYTSVQITKIIGYRSTAVGDIGGGAV